MIFVGRVTRQKGIQYLLEAVHHLDPSVQIVLRAGSPDTPELGQELARQVDALRRRRSNVVWIEEMLDRWEVIQLLTNADVFCCPSIYEPLGLVNLEAMACETAVVGSAVGGIPEVVVDGETGVLVPFVPSSAENPDPADPAAFTADLAAAIESVLGDAERRTAMGQAGRQRVIDHFSWAAIARRTLDLYERAGWNAIGETRLMPTPPPAPPIAGADLRPAVAEDAAELLVLQRCCWVDEALANDTLDIAALHESLDDVRAWLDEWATWCVRIGGRLVGAVRARRFGESWEIGRLMVAPDLGGQGLGRWLLAYAETQAPDGVDDHRPVHRREERPQHRDVRAGGLPPHHRSGAAGSRAPGEARLTAPAPTPTITAHGRPAEVRRAARGARARPAPRLGRVRARRRAAASSTCSTPARVAWRRRRSVRSGEVVSLDLPLDLPDPPLFGRKPYHHDVFALNRNEMDDRLDNFHLAGVDAVGRPAATSAAASTASGAGARPTRRVTPTTSASSTGPSTASSGRGSWSTSPAGPRPPGDRSTP